MRRGPIVCLVLLIMLGPVAAQPPTLPYPRGYKTSLVTYAVVDRSDGLSRDLYTSRDAIDEAAQALRRERRGAIQLLSATRPTSVSVSVSAAIR